MDPVTGGSVTIANGALRNFTFMMGKQQVHSATVDVELCSQVFCAHCRTLDVPSGKTLSPWARPSHDMLRRYRLPKREIAFVSFFFLAFQRAGGFQQVIYYSAAEL